MFLGGLDIGQMSDPTALAIMETSIAQAVSVYQVRYLKRFPLGTSYPDIIDQVHDLWASLGLMNSDSLLCVDYTGVGRPVVDLFLRRAEIPVRPITITGGFAVGDNGSGWYTVPKRDLAAVVQILLRRRRLQIAKGLPESEVLRKELQNFRVKITTAGNETYEAWRDGDHDDLVLATALPCWLGERTVLGAFDVSGGGGSGDTIDGRSDVAGAPPGVFGPGGEADDGNTTLWTAPRR